MEDLLGQNLRDMTGLVEELGFPAFRAKQIFHWVHEKGAVSLREMGNLPRVMQDILEKHAYVCQPVVTACLESKNRDTIKFLLKYPDGAAVETVLMTYDREESRDRNTICVSTQVGCAMGCHFCATGLSGMERNLTAGEIMAQVWAGERYCREHRLAGITNVVFMGMGEPLANLPTVVKSIYLLNDPKGLNIGMRRITVSTCGLAPQIYRLADEKLPITLAISLHAPNNSLRSTLMEINHLFPLEEVLKAARYYVQTTGRRVTYEYALFEGINDSEREARELGHLLREELAHVNIIPANPVPETGFQRSDSRKVRAFAGTVASFGISVYVREEKGVDIDAACGQLRRRVSELESREGLREVPSSKGP